MFALLACLLFSNLLCAVAKPLKKVKSLDILNLALRYAPAAAVAIAAGTTATPQRVSQELRTKGQLTHQPLYINPKLADRTNLGEKPLLQIDEQEDGLYLIRS